PGKFHWRFEVEPGCTPLLPALENPGLAVHMPRYEMAAEFIAHFQRPFQIEPCALAPVGGSREPQRFFPCLDLEPAHLLIGSRPRHYRQADPGTGDRGPDLDRRRVVACCNPYADALVARLDGKDTANIRDDTGKHQKRSFLTHSQYWSVPSRSRRRSSNP